MEKQSTKTISISAGTRVYYIDAFRDNRGQPYVVMSEIPKDKSPQKKRNRIFIHANHIGAFATAINEMVEHINDSQR